MAAPSIPNLLSLRGSRGGGRGRGRGRGGDGHPSVTSRLDAVIQGTDTDAAVSRMSAVDLGYLHDPLAEFFAQKPVVGGIVRRLPIINRGTYTRTVALDRLVNSFLSTTEGQPRQIISLGAGTDTRCFRLFSQAGTKSLIYHEIDFPESSQKKLEIVRNHRPLSAIISGPVSEASTWYNERLPNDCQYFFHGRDLRDLAGQDAPALRGVRNYVPTLLISECCLCYLEPTPALHVVDFFTRRIEDLAIVVYEPIHPDDAFGQQMVSNLAARHIRMPTLAVYKDTRQQQTRLCDAGFDSAYSMTIEKIWNQWIPPEEKERVDSLEGLDEVEEWNLLADHYAVIWGARGGKLDGWGSGLG